MRYYYLAVAETRLDILEAIIDEIATFNRTSSSGITVGILVRYVKWRNECLPCRIAKAMNVPVFIDNGAYLILSSSDFNIKSEKPTHLFGWVKDYIEWLEINVDYYDIATLPDIPIHTTRYLPPEERRKRIAATSFLHSYALYYATKDVRRKLIPVIHGETIEEYEYSFYLHRVYGILSHSAYSANGPYHGIVAVGSLVPRKRTSRKNKIAEGRLAGTLRTWLPAFLDSCCVLARGFHLFGIHGLEVSNYYSHPRYYSCDTGSHGLNYRFKWRTILGCSMPNSPECGRRAVRYELRKLAG